MKKFPLLIGLILSVLFLAGCAKPEPRVVYREDLKEGLYLTSRDPQKSTEIEGFRGPWDLMTSSDGKWLLGIEKDVYGDTLYFTLHALNVLTGKEIFLTIPDEVMLLDDMPWELQNSSTDGGIYISLTDPFWWVPENSRIATWKVNLQTGKFSLVSKTYFDQPYSHYYNNAGLRWDKAIYLFGTFSSSSHLFMYYPLTKEYVTLETKGDVLSVPSWNQDMTQQVNQVYYDSIKVKCWVLDPGMSEVELGCVSFDLSAPVIDVYRTNYSNAIWSPNGKYIALAVYDPDTQMNKVSIFDRFGDFVSSVDGLGYMTVGWYEPLVWSPDSTKIAFLTDNVPWSNTVGIYSLNLSGETKLEYSSPDWGIHSADVIDVVGWVR